MQENLVIVESPAKAKTIEKILGKDFLVKSSFGHIRDLQKKGLSIDLENGFSPSYEVSPDKREVVANLKKLAKDAKMVYLASDEDREGEAIAWHLSEVLGLNKNNTRRIVFHEITPSAIKNAVENPRELDQFLVDAQQARRVLDRLVGFELSPVLWRKVKPSLSAGRVQSVVVKLIVSREREIMEFQSAPYWRVTAELLTGAGEKLSAELSERLKSEAEAQEFLEKLKQSLLSVDSVTKTPLTRRPAPPFTTSTLQQEASRKLGFSVSQTMTLAQRLYEAGHITYMRTDSVNLSSMALAKAKEAIEGNFGEKYYKYRTYTTKSKGAQEAHEAIRPTEFSRTVAGDDAAQQKLYQLIWKRTVATQMSDAQLEGTTIKTAISNDKRQFVSKGEVIIFDGFLKLYIESTDDEGSGDDNLDGLLPNLTKGDSLSSKKVIATERYTQAPARYSEAALVKHLEELGIGRPSTYAPTISTVISRGYVVKESREGVSRNIRILTLEKGEVKAKDKSEKTGSEKNKLFPTDIGMVVTDFLQEHFEQVLDYGFTAGVEEQFDDIAQGKLPWQSMLKDFYVPFHQRVETASENSDYVRSERELGVDPKSGEMVVARVGRYGPMVQIGDAANKKYAKIPSNRLVENITLEEAMELFRLPREVGEYEGEVMVVNAGRFGPYVRHKGAFTSLAKTDDPYTVTGERCVELIEAKRLADKNKIIKEFEGGVSILNGRFGPYISFEKKNYKIPKTTDPATLTLEDCQKMIAEQGEPAAKATKTKTAAKKTATKAAAKKPAAKKTAVKKTTTKKAVAKK